MWFAILVSYLEKHLTPPVDEKGTAACGVVCFAKLNVFACWTWQKRKVFSLDFRYLGLCLLFSPDAKVQSGHNDFKAHKSRLSGIFTIVTAEQGAITYLNARFHHYLSYKKQERLNMAGGLNFSEGPICLNTFFFGHTYLQRTCAEGEWQGTHFLWYCLYL